MSVEVETLPSRRVPIGIGSSGAVVHDRPFAQGVVEEYGRDIFSPTEFVVFEPPEASRRSRMNPSMKDMANLRKGRTLQRIARSTHGLSFKGGKPPGEPPGTTEGFADEEDDPRGDSLGLGFFLPRETGEAIEAEGMPANMFLEDIVNLGFYIEKGVISQKINDEHVVMSFSDIPPTQALWSEQAASTHLGGGGTFFHRSTVKAIEAQSRIPVHDWVERVITAGLMYLSGDLYIRDEETEQWEKLTWCDFSNNLPEFIDDEWGSESLGFYEYPEALPNEEMIQEGLRFMPIARERTYRINKLLANEGRALALEKLFGEKAKGDPFHFVREKINEVYVPLKESEMNADYTHFLQALDIGTLVWIADIVGRREQWRQMHDYGISGLAKAIQEANDVESLFMGEFNSSINGVFLLDREAQTQLVSQPDLFAALLTAYTIDYGEDLQQQLQFNREGLKGEFPTVALYTLLRHCDMVRALIDMNEGEIDRHVSKLYKDVNSLRRYKSELRKGSITAVKLHNELDSIASWGRSVLFDPEHGDFTAVKSQLLPFLAEESEKRDRIFSLLGVRTARDLSQFYRCAQSLAQSGNETQFYTIVTEALSDFAAHLPAGDVTTRDDLEEILLTNGYEEAKVLDTSSQQVVARSALSTIAQQKKKRFNFDQSQLSQFTIAGLRLPHEVIVELDHHAFRPLFTFVWQNEQTGEMTTVACLPDFSEEEAITFDWSLLDDPKGVEMHESTEAFLSAAVTILSAIQTEIDSGKKIAQRSTVVETGRKTGPRITSSQRQAVRQERQEARDYAAELKRQAQVVTGTGEGALRVVERERKAVAITNSLEEIEGFLKNLEPRVREALQETIEGVNRGERHGFIRLASDRTKARIRTPLKHRIILEIIGESKDHIDCRIFALGNRKNVYDALD